MTPEQQILVQETFASIKPNAARFAAKFYARLFDANPRLRALFKSDMTAQQNKFAQMLAFCVQSLDYLEQLTPPLRELGRRHVDYGVTRDLYPLVGEALVQAIDDELGPALTPTARHAWIAAYSLLADLMQNAPERPRLRL